MRDIILIVCVAAIFLLGWLLTKRLDTFMINNQDTVAQRSYPENALRIGLSDPMTAAAVLGAAEKLCHMRPSAEVHMYAGEPLRLKEKLCDGKRDVIFLSNDVSAQRASGCECAFVALKRDAVSSPKYQLPVAPLQGGGIEQIMLWETGSCRSVTNEFAELVLEACPAEHMV